MCQNFENILRANNRNRKLSKVNELLLFVNYLLINHVAEILFSLYGAAQILMSYLDILRSAENYSRVIWDIAGFKWQLFIN